MTTLLKWHLLTLLEQGLQGNSEMYHLVWKAVPPCGAFGHRGITWCLRSRSLSAEISLGFM